MKVNDIIKIKTKHNGPYRLGKILAIENLIEKGLMYLVLFEDYPIAIWFLNEDNNIGIFIESYENNNELAHR